MLLCDVTAPGSLEAVTEWHKVAQSAEWAGGRAAPLAGLLFANKTDLTKRRLISSDSASQLASKLGLHYVEGSAVSCDLLSYSGNTCNSWGLAMSELRYREFWLIETEPFQALNCSCIVTFPFLNKLVMPFYILTNSYSYGRGCPSREFASRTITWHVNAGNVFSVEDGWESILHLIFTPINCHTLPSSGFNLICYLA